MTGKPSYMDHRKKWSMFWWAVQTVKKLKRLGYALALVSGDGKKTTRALGKLIGIKEAHGEQYRR